MKLVILVGLIILASQSALAGEKYVSDVLVIPVRTGTSNQHKIISYLKSGNVVNAREEAGEYTRISAQKGRRRWKAGSRPVTSWISR